MSENRNNNPDYAFLLELYNEPEKLFEKASALKEKYFKNNIDLCSIINFRSGRCSENCSYCAQSKYYATGIDTYKELNLDQVLKAAKEMDKNGVKRFSFVTSGRALIAKDFETLIPMYEAVRAETNLQVCASHGFISYEDAKLLKKHGVTRYHHNLETSRNHFPKICTTHTYDDKIKTINDVMSAGLEICSGGIVGMGETVADRIDMAIELKKLKVKSIPINILTPIKGTPFEDLSTMDEMEILKTLALFRIINEDAEIRIAGGRQLISNHKNMIFDTGISSLMVGNYLTVTGNDLKQDLAEIKDKGLNLF